MNHKSNRRWDRAGIEFKDVSRGCEKLQRKTPSAHPTSYESGHFHHPFFRASTRLGAHQGRSERSERAPILLRKKSASGG